MSLSKPSTPLIFSAAVVFLGCAGEVADAADAETSSTKAWLVVEQSSSLSDVPTVRSHASLWFLRIAEEKDFDAATHLVSARLQLPPVGTCQPAGVADDQIASASISRVELAYAGDVHVRTQRASIPLTVRFFPNVADLVSGVMYTIHDLNDVQAPFDGWLSLTATGSGEFEPLEASTRPPPLPEKLSINGVTLPLVDTVVPREAPIWLGWAPDSDGDIIYIDIDPVPSASVDRIRCAFSDTGLAEIPRQAIPDTTEMMIAVHRSRDVALRSDRGEVGMAHFDLAVTSRVTFASP
ncbi:MAG TPA: hypothetical protein PKW66_13300 [Polyangiaceae bacterium]|nr:hypothetical protein [Polyangiaceae bacterium]